MNSRETYHHGDLKAALLAEALAQLEAGGEATISLRAMAKATGVSPNAPYRHFADKGTLMAAVAAEGFRRFAEGIVGASLEASGRRALQAEARAYLAFADEHPALYRLMFSPEGYSLHSQDCANHATAAFGCLVETAARAQAEGWRQDRDLGALVLALWSALHGWAGLTGDRLIPPGVPVPDREVWLQTALDGL